MNDHIPTLKEYSEGFAMFDSHFTFFANPDQDVDTGGSESDDSKEISNADH
ncbi:MAG TPA: hypothetical protein VK112_03195 [Fodinibius sp.]|nr:hypothetical protein [Fodinibius sp.]